MFPMHAIIQYLLLSFGSLFPNSLIIPMISMNVCSYIILWIVIKEEFLPIFPYSAFALPLQTSALLWFLSRSICGSKYGRVEYE